MQREQPFESVYHALTWAVAARLCTGYGAWHRYQGSVPRPCAPDDVFDVVRGLRRRGLITAEDERVLGAWIAGRRDPRVHSDRAVEVERLIAAELVRRGLLVTDDE